MIINDATRLRAAMNSRSTSLVAVGVVAAVTLIALVIQIALLGALGAASSVGSDAATTLTFTPAVNAQLMGAGASAPIKFDASRC